MVREVRDLLVFDDGLVIATDSVGGIGPKPADTVAADAATVAHFALRVPLLEVLCAGGVPLAVVDALCVEKEPTGALMIAEITRLAAEAGVAPEAVTGSTEENVVTTATGIGVTVIGRLAAEARPGCGSVAGDVVLCLGLPLSAPRDQIVIGHPQQVAMAAIRTVLASGLTHDALPVGSGGLDREVQLLASGSGLTPIWSDPCPVAKEDSGGPSSCVLVSCEPAATAAIAAMVSPAPCQQVAVLA